jgi:hypothetical protein
MSQGGFSAIGANYFSGQSSCRLSLVDAHCSTSTAAMLIWLGKIVRDKIAARKREERQRIAALIRVKKSPKPRTRNEFRSGLRGQAGIVEPGQLPVLRPVAERRYRAEDRVG